MKEFDVKADCFGYRRIPGTKNGEECAVLKKLYCKKEKCSFYKKIKEED